MNLGDPRPKIPRPGKKRVNLAAEPPRRKWIESLNSRLVIQGCLILFHMIKAAMATKESSQPSW